jgi:hypothetical protein
MQEDEATSAWWLWETALQLGAAGGQSTAAAPRPLQGWQEYPPWTLGRLRGLWVAEASGPLHCHSDKAEPWADDKYSLGYSSNSSNNPYLFDHLHKSESSIEQDKPAVDQRNNTVTDADMVKEEQNVPKLLRGGGTNKN